MATPAALRVEIQAMGRGDTHPLSSSCAARLSSVAVSIRTPAPEIIVQADPVFRHRGFRWRSAGAAGQRAQDVGSFGNAPLGNRLECARAGQQPSALDDLSVHSCQFPPGALHAGEKLGGILVELGLVNGERVAAPLPKGSVKLRVGQVGVNVVKRGLDGFLVPVGVGQRRQGVTLLFPRANNRTQAPLLDGEELGRLGRGEAAGGDKTSERFVDTEGSVPGANGLDQPVERLSPPEDLFSEKQSAAA